MRRRAMALAWSSVVIVVAAMAAGRLLAQSGADSAPRYQTPPQPIVDVLDAPPTPGVVVSPTREVVALLPRRSMPAIAELSRPMLRLAGLRINPANNGPHQAPLGTGITLRTVATGVERIVRVPADARISGVSFSPDGRRLLYTNTQATRIELYIADVATGEPRLVEAPFNGLGGCDWLQDSSAALCTFVPSARGPAPAPPPAPSGPNIQESSGTSGPVRTYQDLLTSAHDEELFEYYLRAQLAFVDAASARLTPVGRPGLLSGTVSPNGQFILVERIKRPFSRLVTLFDFPMDVEIWNRRGDKVVTVADVPMGDTVPINGVITGPRQYRWVPVEPATLVWAEALDKGDLRNDVPHRDRLMALKAPFTTAPVEVAKTEFRFGGASWTDTGTILLTENDRRTRTTRTWVMDATWSGPRKLWDRPQQDTYGHPGTPVARPGRGTILQAGDAIYLSGAGASPEGDRPFLDRLDLRTFGTTRLFRSDSTSYESFVGLLDEGGARVLTRAETRTEPGNYFVRDLRAGSKQPVTSFKDPHPQLTQAMATRRFLTYKRKDGVALSGTLYLPVGYQQGQRVPMIVWAYPQEFVDASAASQVVGSPNRFTLVGGSSHLFLLTQGYAVFDGPTMPIVGPGETANDSYVEQLTMSAAAAIDTAVDLGIADRARVGVGGHSYGAFMTANLLAHSDLFAAGVARSGAYNRTLTPFGFQAETRTFWEIPDVYAKMSPFWHAHRIKEPILLIHGEADNNSGTFPIQSERLYMALKGHGATVRYVTLPHESHGYAARESILHVLAETVRWFDTYVKASTRTSSSSAR